MRSMSQPAVTFEIPYQEHHSRLTTFFRFLTVIPPALWAGLLGIGAMFCVVIAWFALLFTGRYPRGLYDFNSLFARYSAKVNGYYFLATDRFPGFSADEPQDYPVRLSIGEPLPLYNRMKVLFRLILLIPPYLIAYAMNIVATVGAILAWFAIVFTGRLPQGIYGIVRLGLSYQVRVAPYFLLMTETWPEFTQDSDAQALRDPGASSSIASTEVAGLPAPDAPAPPLPGGFEPPSAPGGDQSSS